MNASVNKKRLLIIIFFLGLMSHQIKAQSLINSDSAFKAGTPNTGHLWGYAFGDYAYKLHADSAQRGNVQYSKLAKNYNSFNFRRIYLGYDFNFSPNVSSQLLLAHESSFEANTGNTDVITDNNRAVYIKVMNIRLKNIIPGATIVAGQQATPTFATLSDMFWGYRSIEKSITDMRGISSSTDLGLGVFGKIGKGENVGYDVLIGNSNGAKLENNNFKKIYTSLYAYFFDKKLIVQGNFEHDRAALHPFHKDITTFKAFAAYKTPETTIGAEAFQQIQTNSSAYVRGGAPDTAFADARLSGISFYVTQELTKDKLNLFARFDMYNPDSKFAADNNYLPGYNANKESFATLGLDFIPYKNVHIMPNIWYNQYNNKITGAGGNLKNDYDLEGRITLYFIFNK